MDHDCVLNFRTYRDATPPNGYLASDVVRRVYIDSGDHDGAKISASGFIPQGLEVDNFVTATRICSIEKVSNVLYPVIIARDSDDLVVQ